MAFLTIWRYINMMKFVNGFPQEELACMVDVMIGKDKKPHEVRIDAADTLILQWLLHFYPRMNKKKVNDEEYAYISYKKIVEDLPILNTTKRAVAARFKKIEHFGLVKMLVEKDEFGTYTYIHLTKKYFSLLETADGGCPSKNNGVVPRHATKNSKLENSKIRANISQQTDSSASDAPIPAESVRNEEHFEPVRKQADGKTSSYQQKGASPEKSAAGIVKKKPLVKNLTDKDRAALLGEVYSMAVRDVDVIDVPFSMQCGTDHGVATLTMEGAFDYWLDNALYRESAREAYLSKFLEAWKNICDNCADRFWMPARGCDGYVWQNVIKGYANNWNPGTPSERREAKAKEIFE
jgi:hypothetical protein